MTRSGIRLLSVLDQAKSQFKSKEGWELNYDLSWDFAKGSKEKKVGLLDLSIDGGEELSIEDVALSPTFRSVIRSIESSLDIDRSFQQSGLEIFDAINDEEEGIYSNQKVILSYEFPLEIIGGVPGMHETSQVPDVSTDSSAVRGSLGTFGDLSSIYAVLHHIKGVGDEGYSVSRMNVSDFIEENSLPVQNVDGFLSELVDHGYLVRENSGYTVTPLGRRAALKHR